MSVRGRAWLIIAGALLGLIAYEIWSYEYIDMFDQFEVKAVVVDPVTDNYAVVYRYEHANSSSVVNAVWIRSDAPAVGSKEPVGGRPALVWIGNINDIELEWRPANPRLQAKIQRPVLVKTGKNFNDCYFDYANHRNIVCIDPDRVEVLIQPKSQS